MVYTAQNKMTKPIPVEIYLLEKFSSVDYLAELRDTWGEMVTHVDECLERFMLNLPPDYRNWPVSEQPDLVWGERILPNFQDTFQGLSTGVIKVSHGEAIELRCANGVCNDYIGLREYSDAWLGEADRARYGTLLERSYKMASNICATEEPFWRPGDLDDYQGKLGPVEVPATLPAYKINPGITVRTGDPVKRAGIYLPDKDDSLPAYMHTEKPAPEAAVVTGVKDLRDENGVKIREKKIVEFLPCTWTLIERDGNVAAQKGPPSLIAVPNYRTPGGDACPATGYYFTPAREGSRQRFEQGQIMPDLDSKYGGTIWQWDANQQ